MSSNVENPQTPQIPALNTNSSRGFAIADEATQLLLTRLGIMRRKFFKRNTKKSKSSQIFL